MGGSNFVASRPEALPPTGAGAPPATFIASLGLHHSSPDSPSFAALHTRLHPTVNLSPSTEFPCSSSLLNRPSCGHNVRSRGRVILLQLHPTFGPPKCLVNPAPIPIALDPIGGRTCHNSLGSTLLRRTDTFRPLQVTQRPYFINNEQTFSRWLTGYTILRVNLTSKPPSRLL